MSNDSFPALPSAGKIDANHLRNIPKQALPTDQPASDKPRLYHAVEDGFQFDFLWHPNFNHNRIFVLFSGDALRSKLNPPVFQRWKWASWFPGHCLYISDPSLYLDKKLGLSWYAGTSRYDLSPTLAKFIKLFASNVNVPLDNVWTYGSSGGGFAALRILNFLPKVNAICINPQTNILAYKSTNVERFLNICFDNISRSQAENDFSDRFSLLNHKNIFKDRRIIYLQNICDKHHYEDHYIPFCRMLNIDPVTPAQNEITEGSAKYFHATIFRNEEGHRKGENRESFMAAIRKVIEVNPV